MAGITRTTGNFLVAGFWLLVVLAVAFFILFLLQNKQPIGVVQRGATFLANAAKGKEVHA